MTGLREAFVAERLLAAGTIWRTEHGLAHWHVDPYDDVAGPLTRNRAELPELDAEFPDHPLSRARATLRHFEATLRISGALRASPPFEYPPAKKPWWRL